MKNTTIAIDLAKSVFEVGISHRPGHLGQTHRLSREQIATFMANQPATTVIMEACGSAHYWGRRFQGFGHEVKLLPPLYVRPYVQRSKTDKTDVKGMLEASRNSAIRPVPVKTEDQQQLTALHRMRSSWMGARTMRINAARGLLREFGFIFPLGPVTGRIRELIEDADNALSMPLRELLDQVVLEIGELETRISRGQAVGGSGNPDSRRRTAPQYSRDRPVEFDRTGRLRRRCRTISFRSALCLLPGADAEGAFQRTAASIGPHLQTRGRLSPHSADPWGTCRA